MNHPIDLVAVVHAVKIGVLIITIFGVVLYRWIKN